MAAWPSLEMSAFPEHVACEFRKFGLQENYMQPWLARFANKTGDIVILGFLFSGALVDREELIVVDNWSRILPQLLDTTRPGS